MRQHRCVEKGYQGKCAGTAVAWKWSSLHLRFLLACLSVAACCQGLAYTSEAYVALARFSRGAERDEVGSDPRLDQKRSSLGLRLQSAALLRDPPSSSSCMCFEATRGLELPLGHTGRRYRAPFFILWKCQPALGRTYLPLI